MNAPRHDEELRSALSFRAIVTSVQGVTAIMAFFGIVGGAVLAMSNIASSMDTRLQLIESRVTTAVAALIEGQRQDATRLDRAEQAARAMEVAIAELKARQEADLRRVVADNEWLRRQVLEMRDRGQRRPDADRQAHPDLDDPLPEDLREAQRRQQLEEADVAEPARPFRGPAPAVTIAR